MKNILILIFSVFSLAAQAQQMNVMQDTLTWTVTTAANQVDHSPAFAHPCTFVTYGADSLSWIQSEGDYVSNYNVTASTGQWTDTTVDGSTTFSVQNGTITGTLLFARSSGAITIHLQLFINSKLDQDYVFTISSITRGQ